MFNHHPDNSLLFDEVHHRRAVEFCWGHLFRLEQNLTPARKMKAFRECVSILDICLTNAYTLKDFEWNEGLCDLVAEELELFTNNTIKFTKRGDGYKKSGKWYFEDIVEFTLRSASGLVTAVQAGCIGLSTDDLRVIYKGRLPDFVEAQFSELAWAKNTELVL